MRAALDCGLPTRVHVGRPAPALGLVGRRAQLAYTVHTLPHAAQGGRPAGQSHVPLWTSRLHLPLWLAPESERIPLPRCRRAHLWHSRDLTLTISVTFEPHIQNVV
jgi:hypothetical protein